MQLDVAGIGIDRQMRAARSDVDHRISHIRGFATGRQPQQGGVAGPGGVHGVVVEMQRALAIEILVAAVAAIVDDLAVAGVLVLDEQVAVDESRVVAGIVPQFDVVGLDQIELTVARLDPVVTDHGAGRTVLEVVAAAAGAQRAVAVVLEDDAQALGI